MKISSKPLALVIVVVLFGGIALTTALNGWRDGASKVPGKLNSGETAGQYNPADVRGSYTFGDVSKYFNIPTEELRKAFGLPAGEDITDLALKELETISPNVSPHAVGLFAAFYNGLPFSLEDGLLLPQAAAEILRQHGMMTPEQAAYLENHLISGSAPALVAPTTQVAPEKMKVVEPTGDASTGDRTITGSTTFQNLLDWGLSKAKIEEIIGGTIPDPGSSVRSYFIDKGLEFSSYKSQLQAELDE